MSVTIVTTRMGGTHEDVIAAVRKMKAVSERHGAEAVTLALEMAGPNAGAWVIRVHCANWEAFGKLGDIVINDHEARQAIAGLDAVSQLVSRRIIAAIHL
jgi:hypothetical protein